MRTLLSLLLISSCSLIAQDGRGGRGGPAPVIPAGPPKNLRVLPQDTNLGQVMRFVPGGVGRSQCTYCHVAGDFPSDDNAKKNMGRNMIRIAADINANFPDGKAHVTCYTCHRGDAKPRTEAPAPGEAPPAGRGGRGR